MTMSKRERLIALLEQFTSSRVPFVAFATELNALIDDDLIREFGGYKESRVRDFLWYFSSVDLGALPCRGLRDRLKMSLKRVRGDPAYPLQQLMEEAESLKRCLTGTESRWERFSRYLSPFR